MWATREGLNYKRSTLVSNAGHFARLVHEAASAARARGENRGYVEGLERRARALAAIAESGRSAWEAARRAPEGPARDAADVAFARLDVSRYRDLVLETEDFIVAHGDTIPWERLIR